MFSSLALLILKLNCIQASKLNARVTMGYLRDQAEFLNIGIMFRVFSLGFFTGEHLVNQYTFQIISKITSTEIFQGKPNFLKSFVR